jgi:hypothetical protein
MKKIMLNSLLAIMCLFIAHLSFGQKTAPKKKKNASSTAVSLQYCDAAVASAKKLNQPQADAECRTVHQCVPCQDQQTKKATCKTVTVQPTCNSSVAITKKDTKGASIEAEKALPFSVEIMQEQCGNGKISLEAIVFEDGQASFDKKAKQDYSFKWSIGGKDGGTGSDLSCIQAEEAEVQVTKKSNGATITLYIAPPTAVSPNEPASRGAALPVVPTLAAVYKKTGCFGPCPVYEVQFYTDGRVRWEGRANTGTPGFKEGKINDETFAQIQRVAQRIDFFNLNHRYPDYQVMDAPSTIIYLSMNGKEHQVKNTLEAPAELRELEQVFDDIIKKQGWRTSPDKKKKTEKGASNSNN